MSVRSFWHCLAVLAGIFLCFPCSISAQQAALDGRAHLQTPLVLSMGNTAAALPDYKAAFFYNPAHLTHVPDGRGPVVLFGLNSTFSRQALKQYGFYNNRLQPALREGISDLTLSEQQAFFEEIVDLGQNRPFASAALLLPSFALKRDQFGVGGGLFLNTRVHYEARENADGVPLIDLLSMADFMTVVSGALDLDRYGFQGISVGATLNYTQRYAMVKHAHIDHLAQQPEDFYVLGDGALHADLGLHAETGLTGLPGRFYGGAALYNVLGSDFNYRYVSYYDKNEPALDETTVATEIDIATERLQSGRAYRLGVGYSAPLNNTERGISMGIDYLGVANQQRAFKDQLHVGFEVALAPEMALRTGWSQGHPSFGVGFDFSLVMIDYARYYLDQEGLPTGWHHAVRIALGSF